MNHSAQTFSSFGDFYRSAYGDTIQASRSGGQIGVSQIRTRQEAGDWSDAPNPDLVIALVSHEEVCGLVDCGGGKSWASYCTGSFALIPPNCATTFMLDRPHRLLATSIPYSSLLAASGSESGLPADGDFGQLHVKVNNDKEIAQSVYRLWRVLQGQDRAAGLAADGLVLTLAAKLLGLATAKDSSGKHTQLSRWQLQRIREYVSEHLAADIKLSDLAACTGQSIYHFARSFKASTGVTPHRYVIAKRIAAAKDWLTESERSITEIAIECGFSSSQHFATAFKAELGITPSQFRQS